MDNHVGMFQMGGLVVLVMVAALYVLGWRRLRRVDTQIATPVRLAAFGVAMLALGAALVFPLPAWSNVLLAMRSLQKVLICMVAAPLLWLAAPAPVFTWAGGQATQRLMTRLHAATVRRGSFLHGVTQPLVLWFLYLGAFLFWHDPQAAPFLLGDGWGHDIAPWLLLGAAVLFWWPVANIGAAHHKRSAPWLMVVYLLTVEIANMVAGVTIAFSVEPIYAHYVAVRQTLGGDALPLTLATDQMLGGALVWVLGSLAYIAAIILILNRLFRLDGATGPQPPLNWDAHDKFIAPGLEERAAYNQVHNVDLSHR